MRVVVQRVSRAWVEVDGQQVASIGVGFLVLVGIGADDTEEDARWLARKVSHLRVFEDEEGKMNRSVADQKGAILAVPNFTLLADCRKGNRPSFTAAADPEKAAPLFDLFCSLVQSYGLPVQTGVFRAKMAVGLVNDGPVTLLLDSKREF
ncbi:MAG: D-aminoacyl-tRNA deacylase [Armatimonadetes bacterium]|nr:D-aminoacyl-tRNA deacylase [Armatimonadota bacterium]MDW8122226.1 D-aminoacyl-tRNA deacylase [Armatimonadota bacterium]